MANPRAPQTFANFREQLEQMDGMGARKLATQQLHAHLAASSPSEVLAFGQELSQEIGAFNSKDTLARAHSEGRVAFRSWHAAGAVDEVGTDATETRKSETVFPRVGFDALNVLLEPTQFRAHKDNYKRGASAFGPTIEVPTTLLPAGKKEMSVFGDENGTFTALLPEEHYAALFAYNEAAKGMQRRASGPGGEQMPGRSDVEALTAHAKAMRASVTRPVLFANEDIGSYNHPIAHSEPDTPPHVRKGHGMGADEPTLRMSFEDKMSDPVRANAVFYQSYSKSAPPKKNQWNELVLKFRSTGHTAPKNAAMARQVPALAGRQPLAITLTPEVGNPDRSSTKVIAAIPAPQKK